MVPARDGYQIVIRRSANQTERVVLATANLLTNAALDPFGKIPEFKYAACKLGAGDGAGQPA